MAFRGLVVIGKRAIEWILSRCEFHRNIIASFARVWIIDAPVVFRPVFVPGARTIGHRIIFVWFLTDPKNGSYDTFFPLIRSPGLGVE